MRGVTGWEDVAQLNDDVSALRQALLEKLECRLDELSRVPARPAEADFLCTLTELYRLERYVGRAFTKMKTAARSDDQQI